MIPRHNPNSGVTARLTPPSIHELHKVMFNLTQVTKALVPQDKPAGKAVRGQSTRKTGASDQLRHAGLTEIINNLEHVIYATQRGYVRTVEVDMPERRDPPIERDKSLDIALMDWDTELVDPGYTPVELLRIIDATFVAAAIDPVLPESFSYALCGWDVVFAFAAIKPPTERCVIVPGQSVDLVDHLLSIIEHQYTMSNPADRVIFKHLIYLIGSEIDGSDFVTERVAKAFLLLLSMTTVRTSSLPVGFHRNFRSLIALDYDDQFPTAVDVAQYTFQGR